jgi:hypothetical protein
MRAAHQQYVPPVDRSFFVFEPNPASSVTPTDHMASKQLGRVLRCKRDYAAVEIKREVVAEPASLPARN